MELKIRKFIRFDWCRNQVVLEELLTFTQKYYLDLSSMRKFSNLIDVNNIKRNKLF